MLRLSCSRFCQIAFLVLATFTRATAQQTSPSEPDSIHSAAYRASLELQTFALINQYREANHLPTLQWNSMIAKVARGHSAEMATGEVDFGHDGFSDRVTKLKAVLVGVHGAGENVLRTDNPVDVAKMAVEIWLHSPRHLANIRGDFNYSGMGVWVSDKGVIYFTQMFLKLQPTVKPPETETAAEPTVITPFGLLAPPRTR